ncbi:type II toxin-antitoxin system ParD family antitoxin [uncultured Alsobacter sp.]|uniref:type II toxin-antitoxin system ParD family antitoxin n=1 Tax=uncultured Alsobacter sp. TaxID=1748258 RepID=UPI0025FC0FD2|nr:type II toxin-antitoxin system ParD family antitoxin [uncultured Alsobacter sp.]
MPNVSLGEHFDIFIARQIAEGRFQNASEVVRAGLRLLEDQELTRAERLAALSRDINRAFEEEGPDRPLEDVFARLEKQAAQDVKARRRG